MMRPNIIQHYVMPTVESPPRANHIDARYAVIYFGSIAALYLPLLILGFKYYHDHPDTTSDWFGIALLVALFIGMALGYSVAECDAARRGGASAGCCARERNAASHPESTPLMTGASTRPNYGTIATEREPV